MPWRPAIAAVVLAIGVAAAPVLFPDRTEAPDAAAAERVALRWTSAELDGAPRRAGDSWEVDVRRADGSLVEVTLGPELELRELDEELGPDGRAPHDEVTGRLRVRAVATARPYGRGGAVQGVERELDGTFEVGFRQPDESILEVELDKRLDVRDVDREVAGDE